MYSGTCTFQPKVSDRRAKLLARGSYSHFLADCIGFNQIARDLMQSKPIENELLTTLVGFYEQNPEQFFTLSKQTVDSAAARIMVSDLRNEGLVEEQIRGVIRLTPRGYCEYQSKRQRSA
jgi:hypothetical protein